MPSTIPERLDAIKAALAPVFAPFKSGVSGAKFMGLVPAIAMAIMPLRAQLDLSGEEAHALVIEAVTLGQAALRDHDATWLPNWIEGPIDSFLSTEFVRNLAVDAIEDIFAKAMQIVSR